jgi:hypothetical protein
VNHKDLEVWKHSIGLANAVYQLSGDFPLSELYGLTAQIRRSAVSISSNIAEGLQGALTRNSSIFFMLPWVLWPSLILSTSCQERSGLPKVVKRSRSALKTLER